MKFSAWFFLVVGILMFSQWGIFLTSGAVPELKTEPIATFFHLAAEFVTVSCLLTAGVILFKRNVGARAFGLFAAGLLAYTVIASPGYFAQQGQWPLVGMFAILLVLDVFCAVKLLDWRLYGAPAPETCRLLQKAYPDLKIILLSVDADDRQASQDSGATFIHKGAPPAEVLAVLDPLLK